jgi:hypothetical protein
MKARREKQVLSGYEYQWEVSGPKERGIRVNIVAVFCINI